MYKKIESIAQLKREAKKENGLECFIALAGGIVKSSKRIWFYDELFDVYNEVDDTEQNRITAEELKADTNILEALDRGVLYKY